MGEPVEELLAKVLELGEEDRALLAGALIDSLHLDVPSNGDSQLNVEIRRRVNDLETRSVETVAWSEVKERLFRGYE